MQSISNLKMPSSSSNQADQVMQHVLERMQYDDDVQEELNRRFGKTNLKQHRKMIQAGKVNCSKEFSIELEDTSPPYVLGYRLVDLCKIYVG
jgi:hypothetical protein